MDNIFITGGTTGIGWELAKNYLEEGHRVGICGRDLTKLDQNEVKKYSNLICYQVDVMNRDLMHQKIMEFACGDLDILIANAGIGNLNKKRIPDFKLCRKVFDINLYGFLNTFEIGVELMAPRKKGHLVAIASIAGMVGLPGRAAYSASKAAVLKMCESLSIDLKPVGIDVTAIAPGFIDTPMTEKSKHPKPFLLSADVAAKRIKKSIDKKMPLYVFPFPIKVLAYIFERLPRFIYRRIMSMQRFNFTDY